MPNDAHDPLRTLPRAVDPPAALEHRVHSTLMRRGLLRPRRSTVRWIGAVAASLVLFAVGYVTGAMRPDAGPPNGSLSRYALFLYEDETFDAPGPPDAIVAEYRTWAVELHARGRLAAGEKLALRGTVLERRGESIVTAQHTVAAANGVLTGLFIIHAADEAEALRIAHTCPHLKYGGRIDVRPVDDT